MTKANMETGLAKTGTEYEKLSAKMPEKAIQKTKKADTKKAYDTDGYGYQYCIDRFNEVFGIDKWGYSYKLVKESSGTYSSGKPFVDLTVEMAIWVKEKDNARSCIGGHTSSNYADAYKGAITNAFKKTASFFGVGRDAYAGSIDDDNKPLPESHDNKIQEKKEQKSQDTKAPAPANKGIPSVSEIEAQKLKLLSVVYAILGSHKISSEKARIWLHAKYKVESLKSLSNIKLKELIEKFKKMERMEDPAERTMEELKTEIDEFVKSEATEEKKDDKTTESK